MNKTSEAYRVASAAHEASKVLALAPREQKDEALRSMARTLRRGSDDIIAANALDMAAAREKGTAESLLDRLMLDGSRVESMATALEDLCVLDDPVGRLRDSRVLYNGLNLRQVTVPLGVVAMVYEARPNVTADAAGICLKSGNACVLRGGSLAIHSNIAIADLLREAVREVGLPSDVIVAITSTDRAQTDELLHSRGLVDVLIPRGGEGLIRHCVENATVPVIETGTGNCHIYVNETARTDDARAIILNAKTQRIGVCNACESVLVDAVIASGFLPSLITDLVSAGVFIHGDETVRDVAASLAVDSSSSVPALESFFADATDVDWGREYLAREISIKTVADYREAIDHINTYGTHHSESVITQTDAVADAFTRQVDAAVVYVNASTRFSDGAEFGLGAEIGISTQKLHVRGPFALEALVSYKYIVEGEGQVRG